MKPHVSYDLLFWNDFKAGFNSCNSKSLSLLRLTHISRHNWNSLFVKFSMFLTLMFHLSKRLLNSFSYSFFMTSIPKISVSSSFITETLS